MSVVPGPSASRGEITLQPTYFTSSLYVNPCRQDFSVLIEEFIKRYLDSPSQHSFSLFKTIWNDLGWTWLHFKVFDARARETFINVTLRIFAERLVETELPLARVAALFALYTFYTSQPLSSAPSLHSIGNITLCSDVYKSLLSLPSGLINDELRPIRPQAIYILTTLLESKVFYILPSLEHQAMNPLRLPLEIFVRDDENSFEADETEPEPSRTSNQKKRGRPSKRDKQKKAKDAIGALDRWLGKNTYVYQEQSGERSTGSSDGQKSVQASTHILMSHPPVMSRNNYRFEKSYLLDSLGAFRSSEHSVDSTEGQWALKRANEAVLARLKAIDEMAASQGMEVGGEGGEKTGLARVERAVSESGKHGGILSLLEGGGIS